MSYLYVIQKKYEIDEETAKIGSSGNFSHRLYGYVTPEKNFDNNTHHIWLFEITESPYTCYELDLITQNMSTTMGIPYKKYNGTGGKEHYYFDDITKFCNFLDKLNVKYNFSKLDIDTYRKTHVDNVNEYQAELSISADKKQLKNVKLTDDEYQNIQQKFIDMNVNEFIDESSTEDDNISDELDNISDNILDNISGNKSDNESDNESDINSIDSVDNISDDSDNDDADVDIPNDEIQNANVKSETFLSRFGQKEAYDVFIKILSYEMYWGLLLAPTGWGKSFMHVLFIGAYLAKFREKSKTIVLITSRLDVCKDLNHITKGIKAKIQYMKQVGYFPVDVKCKIVDQYNKKPNANKINEHTNEVKIVIINTGKLIKRTKKTSNYDSDDNESVNDVVNMQLLHEINWEKIGFVIFDEVHWAGSRTVYEVMKHIKNEEVEYCIGSSATPFRESFTSQKNLRELFTANGKLSILHEIGYIEAWDNKVIVPIDHIYFKVSKQNVKVEDTKGQGRNKKKYIFNDDARIQVLNEIKKIYNEKSVHKKMILYFSSKKSLLEWHKFIKDKHFVDSKLFVSFSVDKSIESEMKKQNITREDIEGNKKKNKEPSIERFKNCSDHAILFVVFQATEGFDDERVDIIANMDFVQDRSICLLLQKIGRAQRIIEGVKQKGYYLAPILEEEESDMRNKICDALSDFVKVLAKENKDGNTAVFDDKIREFFTNNIQIKGVDNFTGKMMYDMIVHNSITKRSMEKFITILKNNDITKDTYYKFVDDAKNDYLNLPYIIDAIYPEFKWSMVHNDTDKFYTEDEILDKIKDVYKNHRNTFDKLNDDHKKIIRKLSELDNKIPHELPWKHYTIIQSKFLFLFK